MNAPARTLHLLGEHALHSIEERVERALVAWSRDWVREPRAEPQLRAHALSGDAARSGDWVEIGGATGRIWIRNSAEDRNRLVRAVLGEAHLPLETAGDAWSRGALAQADEQRRRCLALALVGEVHATTARAPDAGMFDFASGAVQITCDTFGVHVLADSGVLQHVPPRARSASARPAPKPLKDAARSAPLTLTVGLGSVELNLAHLLDLQPGDVICLPTQLADRVPVMLDGQPVAQGSLGHCGKHKAVQLVSL